VMRPVYIVQLMSQVTRLTTLSTTDMSLHIISLMSTGHLLISIAQSAANTYRPGIRPTEISLLQHYSDPR
jgi:hypothetical protein